jgi:uncharacterized protein YtpQ (UPF0354 family)
MEPVTFNTFVHPGRAYRLQYPAHWEQLTKDDARSCGFGPRERDDVGLWITILPVSIDTDAMEIDLPAMFKRVINEGEGANVRCDPTLQHFGLKADITKDHEGGHFWIIMGGDLVLFASSQVPVNERDTWNPQFDHVMSSLEISRDRELLLRKTADEVHRRLRELHPDQDYFLESDGIRGRDGRISLANVYKQVEASPERRRKIVAEFIDGLASVTEHRLGHEPIEQVREDILPVLKPTAYLKAGTAAERLAATEWMGGVVICYAIRTEKIRRLLTGWDIERWAMERESLHQLAMENLSRLPWPERLEGARHSGGRLIMVSTNDSLGSSRLLHPDLHRLFSAQLGTRFYAGVPNSGMLVLFSAGNRPFLNHVLGQLRRDYDTSAYSITPHPFLVTPGGIKAA